MTIREMTPQDLEEVLAIERGSFTDPFSRGLFESELAQEKATLLVALDGGKIVGYIDYWFVLGELHVINLAIHPDARRRGVATRLMDEKIRRSTKATVIFLEVRESSGGARQFYEKSGFVASGKRKGYYAGREDAILMEKKLQGPDPIAE